MVQESPPRRDLVVMAVLFEGGLAAAAFFAGWWWNLPLWEKIHWDIRAVGWGVLACLPMLIGFLLCLYCSWGPLLRIKQFTEQVIQPMFARCDWWDLALISAMAGLGEETLFRGIIQGFLADRWHPWGGLILASFLFGCLHPFTPIYVLLATAMGAYLGFIWMAGDNLLIVIIAHGLYDFLVLM